jgi:hypothetical protein
MDFKGTKGKWNLIYDDDHYVVETENENICACIIMDNEMEQQVANGRLISSAPELLEALINIRNNVNPDELNTPEIDLLINKALGKNI